MTKAHGSTLYLGSGDMELMIGLLGGEISRQRQGYSEADRVMVEHCEKLRDKLRSKQYHPTRKK